MPLQEDATSTERIEAHAGAQGGLRGSREERLIGGIVHRPEQATRSQGQAKPGSPGERPRQDTLPNPAGGSVVAATLNDEYTSPFPYNGSSGQPWGPKGNPPALRGTTEAARARPPSSLPGCRLWARQCRHLAVDRRTGQLPPEPVAGSSGHAPHLSRSWRPARPHASTSG